MAKSSDTKQKKIAVSRYALIVLALFIIAISILVSVIDIQYVEGDMWRELGEKRTKKVIKDIPARRGDIYSDDGRMLATSQPLYNIYMDFMADGIVRDSLMKHVGALSASLNRKFPQRSAAQYKKILLDGWELSRKEIALIRRYKEEGTQKRVKTKSRYVRLVPGDINYLDLLELRSFPFLNQKSNKSGMIEEERTTRIKPFGNLAGRTVGSIYKGVEAGGTSGIELKYDSLIRGVPGKKFRQRVGGRWSDRIELEPESGISVHTTLDIEVQDLTEKALYDKLVETQAESGCAVIMEVKTGEIKAIVNLDRTGDGDYAEGNPNVFSYMSEPGSTFKTVSLLAALDDGLINPSDSFYVGSGVYDYKGRQVRDHYWRHGSRKDYMTVNYGMQISSNVVLAKMILQAYGDNPKKFVDKIEEMGLTQKLEWDVPLKGIEGTSRIRKPDDKANPWSKTTLPWMSFGYETQVPPIYILMFYNAIANDGRMIKPYIAKVFEKNGEIIKEHKSELINPSIASKKALNQIKEILREVVLYGTGIPVNSEYFPISGKTGTALIASGGSYGNDYFVSFCGYFPSDEPKYTAFVGIRRPKGYPSGGGMPGEVFKKMAEGVYFKNQIQSPIEAPVDTVHKVQPKVKNGMYEYTKIALSELKQKYSTNETSEWVMVAEDEGKYIIDANATKQGLVPNVIGMGARDAVYILESLGLRVNLIGSGRVVRQTIQGGARLIKGTSITIELK